MPADRAALRDLLDASWEAGGETVMRGVLRSSGDAQMDAVAIRAARRLRARPARIGETPVTVEVEIPFEFGVGPDPRPSSKPKGIFVACPGLLPELHWHTGPAANGVNGSYNGFCSVTVPPLAAGPV